MMKKLLSFIVLTILITNSVYSLGLQLIFHLYNNGAISLTNISLSDFYFSPEIYDVSQYFNISQIPREKIWTLELTLKNGSVSYKTNIYSEMFFWIFVDGPNITSNIVIVNETYTIFYVPFDKDLKKVTIRDWNGKILFEKDISNDVLRLIVENCEECMQIVSTTNVIVEESKENNDNLLVIFIIVIIVILILIVVILFIIKRKKNDRNVTKQATQI